MRAPSHWDTYEEHYAGYDVREFHPGGVTDPGHPAWWLTFDDDAYLDAFFDEVGTTRVRALVCGWDSLDDGTPEGLYDRLAGNADRLPGLRSLFLGNMPPEVCEISWIGQADVTPLLAALPGLERLEIRGSDGLSLGPVRHERLKTLRIESGGLPGAVVRSIGASDLPALEHLELWLGVADYLGDHTAADLAALLTGDRLPALRHLGLQNSERQDEIAAQVAAAPVVARLESLALSMGVLTDLGAEHLLDGGPLTHLRTLDLHHNFFGDAMIERLRKALPGVDLDLDRAPHWQDGGYVSVTE
ncbi:STM4015 family protein [Herbidospora cretacea]|uniref:STM4015 family protein n=1 Tax=Herbidospora cretacea TaxID=28444 RepID=UPI0009DCFB9F|nr:STM4015 family protein [Herbidospora cretacea]